MLRWRLLVAAVILIPLGGLLWLDYRFSGSAPGIWLVPLAMLFGLAAAAEVLEMLAAQGHRPSRPVALGGTGLILGAAAVPTLWGLGGTVYPPDCPLGRSGWPLLALTLVVGWAFWLEMRRYREPGGVVLRVAWTLFVVTYVGLLTSFFVLLRSYHSNRWGFSALVTTILIVKLSDVGAYAFGRLLGRHKLAPKLSPGKTWEGAFGGLVAAIAAGWLSFVLLIPALIPEAAPMPAWRWVLFSLIVTAAGIVGDLAESLLKRDMGCKDSSRWIPGLGGVLDILDSLLFAAPAAYACWVTGLVGP